MGGSDAKQMQRVGMVRFRGKRASVERLGFGKAASLVVRNALLDERVGGRRRGWLHAGAAILRSEGAMIICGPSSG